MSNIHFIRWSHNDNDQYGRERDIRHQKAATVVQIRFNCAQYLISFLWDIYCNLETAAIIKEN